MGNDLHGGNKSKVSSITRLQIVEFLLNYLEVSPQVEPGPEAGAGSVEDKEKAILYCSVQLLVTGPVESFVQPDSLLSAVPELLWG